MKVLLVNDSDQVIGSYEGAGAYGILVEIRQDEVGDVAAALDSELRRIDPETAAGCRQEGDRYPREIAREVSALRPDLAAGNAISTVLTIDPTLTADEVIEILDKATAEEMANRRQEEEQT